MDDAGLVGRARQGAAEAFTLLVERYRDAIYGLDFRELHDFEDARDVAQAGEPRFGADLTERTLSLTLLDPLPARSMVGFSFVHQLETCAGRSRNRVTHFTAAK